MTCLDVDSKWSEILLSSYWICFEIVSILGLKCCFVLVCFFWEIYILQNRMI